MRAIYSFLLILCFALLVSAQSITSIKDLNPGFEKVSSSGKLPDGWYQFGSGYSLKVDTSEKKSGKNSVLIEPLPDRTSSSFGSVAITIPAGFDAKEIELRGYIKYTDVSDGFVGLWMRIESDSAMLAFDNMQSTGLKGTADWKEYSVKLPLSEDATKVTVGALLVGTGRLWVDDISLSVDGKDITEAKLRPPTVYKASLDKEFVSSSRIADISLNKSKIEDLTVLGKVWGFLKYYHPAVMSGDHNWDFELFRILPAIIKAKNRQQRNDQLAAWIEKLGPIETETAKPIAGTVKLSPDLAWIDAHALGKPLYDALVRVRDAKRAGKSYYIAMNPGVGNPQFKNEDPYRSMAFPDTGYRLLSLFRYWNIVQYFNPNRNLIGEDWNSVLPEFIPRFVNAANETEYKLAALSLIAKINDTHANIWGQDETLQKYRGLNAAPVVITFVEDKAVVTSLRDKDLADKAGLKIGDVITSINGRNVADMVKERLDITPASNYPTKLRDLAGILLRTNDSELKIRLERDGKLMDVTTPALPPDKFKSDEGSLFAKKIDPFKIIDSDISYLYPGSLKQGDIQKVMPQIAATKGLIIDLRCYPSDFIVFSLGEFLMPKPTSFVKFSNGSVTTPGLFTMTEELTVGRENKDAYTGKVVILINEITLSQAEYTTMALRRAPRAIVIGSTTAGADGNVSPFYLPGGISTMISGIGVYYPDGKDTQRVGIIPDIVVKPTIKGIREGRDEVLEKAIELIKQP